MSGAEERPRVTTIRQDALDGLLQAHETMSERATTAEADLAAITEAIGGLNEGESLVDAVRFMVAEHEAWSKTVASMYQPLHDLAAARARIAELIEAGNAIADEFEDYPVYTWHGDAALDLGRLVTAWRLLVPTTSEGGQQAAAGGESDE